MSKLDEAFLKAYTKDRRAVTRSEPTVPADSTVEQCDSEIWIDVDGERVVRRDDGVLNVASFIARSPSGRVRGGAPGDSTAAPTPDAAGSVRFSPPAENQPAASESATVDGSARLSFDAAHSLRGPHFQPISLDLAAFDLFTQTDVLQPAPLDAPAAPSEAATSSPSTAKVLRIDAATAAPTIAPEIPAEPKPPAASESTVVSEPPIASATEPLQSSPPAAEPTVPEAKVRFQAAWEVDRFEFEEIVEDLCEDASPLWEAARQLRAACQEGLKVLAVTSPLRAQGRSTLAITLARMVATSGLGVLLLDGDVERPALADKLSLQIERGWDEALRIGLPAEEVAVHSVTDRFTVLPLDNSDMAIEERPTAAATTAMFESLIGAFDLVIVDAGHVNAVGGWIPGADVPCLIDAALVIDDARCNDPHAQQACIRRLQKLGIENVGIVENFTE